MSQKTQNVQIERKKMKRYEETGGGKGEYGREEKVRQEKKQS